MNPPAQPRQPPPHAAQPGGTPVDTTGSHTPEPVDLSAESVAGEEDPGAGLDMEDVAPPSTPPQKPREPQKR